MSSFKLGDKKFNNIKESAEKLYKETNSVFCPYLNENVVFNAKGLEHLKFKRKNHTRPKIDQFIKWEDAK